jgi:hypothetical protein
MNSNKANPLWGQPKPGPLGQDFYSCHKRMVLYFMEYVVCQEKNNTIYGILIKRV